MMKIENIGVGGFQRVTMEKIDLIKMLRRITNMGLHECKEAVDVYLYEETVSEALKEHTHIVINNAKCNAEFRNYLLRQIKVEEGR